MLMPFILHRPYQVLIPAHHIRITIQWIVLQRIIQKIHQIVWEAESNLEGLLLHRMERFLQMSNQLEVLEDQLQVQLLVHPQVQLFL